MAIKFPSGKRLGRKVGLALASLAVFAMTLLQVDPSYAATTAQGTEVNLVLSQGQLVTLARQDRGLYRHVMEAYRSGSRVVVTRRQYQVLSHLKTTYLNYAKAGQTACPPGQYLSSNGKCAVLITPKAGAAPSAGTVAGPLGPLIGALTQFSAVAPFIPGLAAVVPFITLAVVILTIINDIWLLFLPAQSTK